MPAGFQAWNDGSILQIDENYKNLKLLSKFVVNSYASTEFQDLSVNALQEVTASFNSSVPVLAVACSAPIALIDLTFTGTPPYTSNFRFLIHSTSQVFVTFYAFDPQTPSGANYGMQVFNASGELVFDAAHKPLRVIGQIVSPGAASTYNYPAGRQYAMIISELIAFVLAPNTFPLDPLDFYTRFARTSGNSIITQEIKHYANPPWSIVANQIYDNRAGRILIADVTGY